MIAHIITLAIISIIQFAWIVLLAIRIKGLKSDLRKKHNDMLTLNSELGRLRAKYVFDAALYNNIPTILKNLDK